MKRRWGIFLGGALLLGTAFVLGLWTTGMGRHPAEVKSQESAGIVNTHEHFQSFDLVEDYLKGAARGGIVKTVALGSPEATIAPGEKGFFGEERYNLEVLKMANTYPDRFLAFPTINVRDPARLKKLQQYMKMGAAGLKLYNGHSFYYERPLDDASMLPVYAYCEANQIPVVMHVNVGYYQQEFENVLKQFPRMKVVCPHFCLSTIETERFEYLMDTYPQLYTDITFGHMDFLNSALLRFSEYPERYRELINKYQDRIFFGTDMVVTRAAHKTVDWMSAITQVYRDLLEKESYTFFGIEDMTLRGLHLSAPVLDKIYHRNFDQFIRRSPEP